MVLSQHNPLCGVGPACSPVVIVGGGVSGGYAINRWTEIAPPPTCPCPLMVIGEEAVVSYERPALSKGFLNKNVRPPHFNTCVGSGGTPHDEVYYGKHCVEFITNKKVVKLDVDARTLTLNTGETVSYSAVVLGTGSTAREFDGPGSNLKGVHKLRNLADGLKLVESIEECKKKKGKAVVIGSGFLGVEVASALVSLGINSVTMISKEPHIMTRLLPPHLASVYTKHLVKRGIRFMASSPSATAISGDDNGHVNSVTLEDGSTFESDLVLISIGSIPRTELLDESFINDDPPGGILVDRHFHVMRKDKSSLTPSPPEYVVEGVYAMGEVASVPLEILGGLRSRMEQVQMARESAARCMESVVYDLFHESKENKEFLPKGEFDYLPYSYSNYFDIGWRFLGLKSGGCVFLGDLDPSILGVWIDNDRVVGIFLETGGSKEFDDVLKRIVRNGPRVSREDIENCGSVDRALILLMKSYILDCDACDAPGP